MRISLFRVLDVDHISSNVLVILEDFPSIGFKIVVYIIVSFSAVSLQFQSIVLAVIRLINYITLLVLPL